MPTILVAHPSGELYGADRMMLESVDAFLERGWRVTVALAEDGPLVAEVRRRGAHVLVVPTAVLRKSAMRPLGLITLCGRAAASLLPAVRLVRRTGADAVYVSTLTVPLWIVAGRLAGRPVLCHVHEAEGRAAGLVRKALAMPLLLATAVVANSRYSSEVLSAAVPSLGRRTQVIYNGVPGPPDARPARERIEQPLRVLYVGRLSPRKGVDVALEAVGMLLQRGVSVRLDLAGAVFTGYEWFETRLRDRVRELGAQDAVAFRGFTRDVWSCLDRTDVVVVPSRLDEPFGNTAVEAGLAARPLVVSDTSGLREAAAGLESAVFVRPDDAVALADAIVRVRDAWPRYRTGAVRDAEVLRRRHAVEGYRSAVAEVLGGLLDRAVLAGPAPAPRPQAPA